MAIRDIVRRMINITQLEFERRADDVDAMLDLRRSAPAPPGEDAGGPEGR